MKQKDFDHLKKEAQHAARTGNVSAFTNPAVAQKIISLVASYDAMQRAEDFWGERAPMLNDELLAIRPLEKFARLVANGANKLTSDQRKELLDALANLDAVRAAQAKKTAKADKAE